MLKAGVIRAAGTNCDQEMVRAFALAGARAETVHLDRLVEDPARLGEYDLLGFPGGFSFGDDVASGRIFAVRVRERLWGALRSSLERGVPVIGACNGFQVLVQVGLLPGPEEGGWPAGGPPRQSAALTDNVAGRFIDRWVPIELGAGAERCVWTRGLVELARSMPAEVARDVLTLPVAHGEGRLVGASPDVLDRAEAMGRAVVRYGENFNGSDRSIAGLSDATGRVFGLMPHPERYLEWTRHPYWTRLPASVRRGPTPGLAVFLGAVEAAGKPGVAAGARRPQPA